MKTLSIESFLENMRVDGLKTQKEVKWREKIGLGRRCVSSKQTEEVRGEVRRL